MRHAAVRDDRDVRPHDRPGLSDAGRLQRWSCDRQRLL